MPISTPPQAVWLPSLPRCMASCEAVAETWSSNCDCGEATRAGRFAGRLQRLLLWWWWSSSPNTLKMKAPSVGAGSASGAGLRFRVPRGLPVQPGPSCRAGCDDVLFSVASPSTFSPTWYRRGVAAVSSVAPGVSTFPSGRGAQDGIFLNGDLFFGGDSPSVVAWTWRAACTTDGRSGESVDGRLCTAGSAGRHRPGSGVGVSLTAGDETEEVGRCAAQMR